MPLLSEERFALSAVVFCCGVGAVWSECWSVLRAVTSGRVIRNPSSCSAHAQWRESSIMLWDFLRRHKPAATPEVASECKRCGSAKLKSKIFMETWVQASRAEAGPQAKHFWYWTFRGWASWFSAVWGSWRPLSEISWGDACWYSGLDGWIPPMC